MHKFSLTFDQISAFYILFDLLNAIDIYVFNHGFNFPLDFFIRVSDLIDWIKFFIPFFFVYSYHGTVGKQLYWSTELPILLLFSDIAVYPHDEHFCTVFVLRFES